jgi:hypothetical protein
MATIYQSYSKADLDNMTKCAARARARLKRVIDQCPETWKITSKVRPGGTGPYLRLNICLVVPCTKLANSTEILSMGFQAEWNYPYSRQPTSEEVRKYRYCTRYWSVGDPEEDLAGLVRFPKRIREMAPLVYSFYRLAHPDRLIQMAGEADWRSACNSFRNLLLEQGGLRQVKTGEGE